LCKGSHDAAASSNGKAVERHGTQTFDFLRFVAGTSVDENLLERQLSARWPPQDGQPTQTLEQNLLREPQTERRPPKDGRPTQTDARQQRIEQAHGFEDERHAFANVRHERHDPACRGMSARWRG
jgi:hypothetical protein